MKRYFFVAYASMLMFQIHSIREPHGIKIESELLAMVDGSVFMDRDAINEMKFVEACIKTMVNGRGHHASRGTYGPCNFSLNELIEYEAITPDSEAHKAEVISQTMQEMKQEFVSLTDDFRDKLQMMKDVTVKLIAQACKQRNKPKSFLLRWAKTTPETELAVLEQDIQTPRQLKQFCIDLVQFMNDMLKSCPISWANYVRSLEQ